jgi:hypothetical protein
MKKKTKVFAEFVEYVEQNAPYTEFSVFKVGAWLKRRRTSIKGVNWYALGCAFNRNPVDFLVDMFQTP